MDRGHQLFSYLIEHSILSTENCPGQSIVEIVGDNRVLIEAHNGVAAYSQKKILIKVKYGTVSICGCNLEIKQMTKNQLVIVGQINSVEIHRGR